MTIFSLKKPSFPDVQTCGKQVIFKFILLQLKDNYDTEWKSTSLSLKKNVYLDFFPTQNFCHVCIFHELKH